MVSPSTYLSRVDKQILKNALSKWQDVDLSGIFSEAAYINFDMLADDVIASRLPKLSMRKERHPFDVWKSAKTSSVTSVDFKDITFPEIRSVFEISSASEESESMQMLTKHMSG